MEKVITLRARAFYGEGVREHQVMVDSYCTVRVWDDVANHFTLRHSLCRSAVRRAIKLAMPWRVRLNPEGLVRRRFLTEAEAKQYATEWSGIDGMATVEREV